MRCFLSWAPRLAGWNAFACHHSTAHPIQWRGATTDIESLLLVCLVCALCGWHQVCIALSIPPCTPCICGAALSNKWTLSGTGTSTGTFDLATCSSAASFFSLCFAQAKQKSDKRCVVPEFGVPRKARCNSAPATIPCISPHPEQTGHRFALPGQDSFPRRLKLKVVCIAYDTIRFPHVAIRSLHAHRCRILPLSTVLVVARSQSRRSALVCPRAHSLSFSVLRYC
ncbi:hypothetical protein J3E69DRAFT_104197 [Trichoderma sp. SZMC 28015]